MTLKRITGRHQGVTKRVPEIHSLVIPKHFYYNKYVRNKLVHCNAVALKNLLTVEFCKSTALFKHLFGKKHGSTEMFSTLYKHLLE